MMELAGSDVNYENAGLDRYEETKVSRVHQHSLLLHIGG
jgi:hypothetical protein